MFIQNCSSTGKSQLFKTLTSMKMGLFLLLLLAVVASVGTFVPQGQQPAYYAARYGPRLGVFFLLLSFDQVYTSWWFLTLASLLALNLFFCSLHRLRSFTNYQEFGSILLHISMLVIFSGALISGLTSQQTYIEIGEGDSYQLKEKNFLALKITVQDFDIDYYANHEPKQFTSQLALEDSQGQQIQQAVSVNHPLNFHGMKIYQQNYGFLLMGQVQVGNKTLAFAEANGREVLLDAKGNLRLKLLFIPDYDEQGNTLQSITPMLHNPRLVVALLKGEEVLAAQPLAKGETKELQGHPVTFDNYRYFTGLQIKKDPGTNVVFCGFALLLLGFVIRYLAPKQNKKWSEQ